MSTAKTKLFEKAANVSATEVSLSGSSYLLMLSGERAMKVASFCPHDVTIRRRLKRAKT